MLLFFCDWSSKASTESSHSAVRLLCSREFCSNLQLIEGGISSIRQAQRPFCILTVPWITPSSMHCGVPVGIIAFHPFIHIQFTFLEHR